MSEEDEEGIRHPQLELQTVVNGSVGAGRPTWVLWKEQPVL